MNENPTVAEALGLYKMRVSIQKKGYEQEKYRIDSISKSFLGSMFVRDVTSVHIATYRDQRLDTVNPKTLLPLSTSTVRLELSLLQNFFSLCVIEWGYCETNPAAKVKKPKPQPGRDRLMTPREERLIGRYTYNHVNRDFYSIFIVAVETAMRLGEILALRWENINLKRKTAFLPDTKNGTSRSVPLSSRAREALIRMGTKGSGSVFGYTSAGFKCTWKFMLNKLGIVDLHFHDLRHTCITRLFELGTLSMMEIALISGHKSLSMLKRYTHLSAERIARKLEGNRHKGKQVVLDHLIPYPAHVASTEKETVLRLLDFDDLQVSGNTLTHAIELATEALFKRLMTGLVTSAAIPQPDQYLETVQENQLVMIHPLEALRT